MNWYRAKTYTGSSDDSTIFGHLQLIKETVADYHRYVRTGVFTFLVKKSKMKFSGVSSFREFANKFKSNLPSPPPHSPHLPGSKLLLVVVLVPRSNVLYSSPAGGWTLVKRVKFSNGQQPTNGDEIQTADYRIQLSKYSSNLHLLVTEGLKNLRSDMGFQQFRFYCRKATPGSVSYCDKSHLTGGGCSEILYGEHQRPSPGMRVFHSTARR